MTTDISQTPLEAWIKNKISPHAHRLTRQAIADYQLKKLQEMIHLAYQHSPFYHSHLKGIGEQQFNRFEDVVRLPFTTPLHIREQGLKMLCVSQDEIHRVVTLDSSGTTGKPKRLYFTREDQRLTIDFFKQAMSTFTKPGQRVIILLPAERQGSVGDLLAIALAELGAVSIKYGAITNMPATVNMIANLRADILVGIPIQVLALARYCEADPSATLPSLRQVLLSTDSVSQAVVTVIQRVFHCEVFDHYGMTEMGLGGGIECCAHHGYHMRENDLYIEIIDPKTGELLPQGQYGEVVVTTLTRRGMPLIRYRTGDLSRFIPERCLCGTILYSLERIKNRIDSSIVIADKQSLTLAELDEKLLVLPHVLDFTAKVFRQSTFIVLKIEIILLSEAIHEEDIYRALFEIPALRFANETGSLQLVLDLAICTADYIPRFGKRKIVTCPSCTNMH